MSDDAAKDALLRRAAESMRRTRRVLEEEQFFNLIDVATEATIVRFIGEDWDAWRAPQPPHTTEAQA